MENRRRVAAVDTAGQQNHVRAQQFEIGKLGRVQLERRRAHDFGAGAERRLVGRFDGQTGNVADDDDAQAAGGAARRQNEFIVENRQILRCFLEESMALVQRNQRAQQPLTHVGEYRRGRLAAPKQLGAGQIHRADFGKRAAEIDEDGERSQINLKGKSKKAKFAPAIQFLLFNFTFCLFLFRRGDHAIEIHQAACRAACLRCRDSSLRRGSIRLRGRVSQPLC